MELYGIEKLSLVDYDGRVSATVFTATCNFRCGFCHNGPLVTGVKQLKPMDNGEIFDFLKKRVGILDAVCITGGEPTLQKDLPEFCESVKNIGYAVKLDTNGTNPEMVKTLIQNGLIDYLAMDIKNDKENYAKIIGFDHYDTTSIQKTIDFLISGTFDFEFRTTLIAEYHKPENIEKIGEWIKGTKRYFFQKFKLIDTCISSDLHGVEETDAKNYLEIIKKYVPDAKLRGY